ncbi:hypothetical protein NECAME_03953 [Necator americanus]|uniref:Uncharacterized protein n=1 Tax=Necator americanus TaxID=51031 RepID=W2SYC3_NECAM|nr:hypothetical protein NECAME_03953 [Necator americanus]ETN74640.1 hypothetical protein NECAME_03953 [Necator americanus]
MAPPLIEHLWQLIQHILNTVKSISKERIVEKLRELVFQCDQTTKACASHYFKNEDEGNEVQSCKETKNIPLSYHLSAFGHTIRALIREEFFGEILRKDTFLGELTIISARKLVFIL